LQLNLGHVVAIIVDHRAVVLSIVIGLAVSDDQGALDAPGNGIHQDRIVVSRLRADLLAIEGPRHVAGTGNTAGKALDPGRIPHQSVLRPLGTDRRRTLQIDISIRRYLGVSGNIGLAVVPPGGLVAHAECEIRAGAYHPVTGMLDPHDLRLRIAVHLAT